MKCVCGGVGVGLRRQPARVYAVRARFREDVEQLGNMFLMDYLLWETHPNMKHRRQTSEWKH